MKNLIELYKSVGESVGVVSDNQGFMSTLLPGSETPKPWTVNSKRLVLPVPEQLKQTDWTNRIGFHPLLQNVASGGESSVMEKFRDRMNGYADYMLGMLMRDIALLGTKEAMHKELTPSQAAYLGPFSDADQKFCNLLTDLVSTKRPSKKNYEFVRFSVIKGRVWQGQKRMRVAVMHFPLYEQLPETNEGATILGHKLRIKDVRMLRAMYEYLFPSIREPNYYEVGSDSKIGPSFEALMELYGIFTEAQNKAVSILEPVLDTSNALLIVDDWREDIKQVDKLLTEIRHIPMLEGNSPSEKIAQALAPQRIGENNPNGVPVIHTANPTTAPVISASLGAQLTNQSIQQEATPMQQNNPVEPQPRVKLGIRAPTVNTVDANHQLPSNIDNSGNTIGYARPAPTPLLPPVGANTQPQQTQQSFGMRAGNVLPNQQAMVAAQTPQAMKIPESARMVNNILYIPLEANGVNAMPAGAILIDAKPYVPFGGVAGMPVAAAQQAAAFNPVAGRFGAQQQQQAIVDPSQVPGLSAEEIAFYRTNPVMWQNYLAQVQSTNMAAANTAMVQRQQQVPRYLQTAVQQAQLQQQNNGGFFSRRIG